MLALFCAVLFIALNGFFVAAEFAMVKVSTTLPHAPRARHEDPKVTRAREVVARIDRYLSVTQLGITLASLGLGWIGEPAIEDHLTNAVVFVVGHVPGKAAHVVTTAIAFALLTFSHVLFGELVPKLVAIQKSEDVAFSSAGLLHFVFVVFRPLLWVLERATALILRAMGMSADAAAEGRLSEEELLGILAANAARSPGGPARAELFERVVRFAQRTARHAMVPRVDVFTLPVSTSGEEALKQIRTHEYSRIVLTKQRSLDDVAGYLYAKDLLLNTEAAHQPDLRRVLRDIVFVPETQSLLDVLRDMQRSQIPIAVVVDEYGGTSGIVTMEDLLEEIVGEIRDELDVEGARVAKTGDTTWDVDARAPMEEIRSLGVLVDEDEWAETVGTVVLNRLGRIPRIGDTVELGPDIRAEITSVSRRRILRIRLHARKPEGED